MDSILSKNIFKLDIDNFLYLKGRDLSSSFISVKSLDVDSINNLFNVTPKVKGFSGLVIQSSNIITTFSILICKLLTIFSINL